MTRSEAEKKVKELDGKISKSVSKKLDYLVVGEKPGSKLQKAEALNIVILTEQQFQELFQNS